MLVRSIVVALLAALVLVLPVHAQKMMKKTDLEGHDYRNALTKDVRECQVLCESEARCRAWSALQEMKEVSASCWLKDGVGAKIKRKYVTSGLRSSPIPPSRESLVLPEPPPLASPEERARRVPEEVVELHRPRMNLRKLTKAEKQDARTIGLHRMEGLTWAEFHRLQTFAEAGDTQAMADIINVLTDSYNDGLPFETRSGPMPRTARIALAGLWSAHLAELQGEVPTASKWYYIMCFPINHAAYPDLLQNAQLRGNGIYGDCGVNVSREGKSKKLSFTYYPVWGGEATETRLNQIFGRMAIDVQPSQVDAAWLQRVSELRDLSPRFLEAEEKRTAFLQAREAERKANEIFWHERKLGDWAELFGKQGLDAYNAGRLEAAAAHLGAEYLELYAEQYTIRMASNLEKLCNQGSAWCTLATARHQKYQQQIAAAYEASEYDRRAAAATMWQMPGQVQVRVVDGNGNYHMATMSSFQAALIGAKPDR